MIVGNGLMATACRSIDRDDIIIFASGVSDSAMTDALEFKWEEALLRRSIDKDKVLIYFGAIGGQGIYLNHKEKMKSIVRGADKHIILNLSQVVGNGGNPNNLFNTIRTLLVHASDVPVYRDCLRSFIDVVDVVMVLDGLISDGKYGTHDFYGVEPLPVDLIVQLMAESLHIDAYMVMTEGDYVKKGNSTTVKKLIADIEKEGYTKRLINKYI